MEVNAFFSAKEISSFTKLTGGDINQVFKSDNRVFKINKADEFPKMFEAEAMGLKMLSSVLKTPEVIGVGVWEQLQYIELEYIEEGTKTTEFWTTFGRELAKLHQVSNERFGLESSNYIGSLVQQNNRRDNWKDFLIEERLQPMIEMAVNSGEVNYVESKLIEPFYHRLEELYPIENPALLHGDLWGGNYICGKGDVPVLIDPAVYFGHREMDLGMMNLFGGFDDVLFEEYNNVYPLEAGWKARIELNQLYPLLVHVNLFGRSYWSQVASILKPFSL